MPDSAEGVRVRVQALEREMAAADGSRARMWEAIGDLRTAVAVLSSNAETIAKEAEKTKDTLDQLKGEVVAIRTKVAVYSAAGGLIGAGVVSFVVAIATGGA